MSGKSDSTLYDVLGLAPGASALEVRNAWRRLAQQHHPDRGDTADGEAMARINQAYEVLSDPDRRARYDHGRLRAGEPRRPGRVDLPGDRARVRWRWTAAGTLIAASAAWALVQGWNKGDTDEPPTHATPATRQVAPIHSAAPVRPIPVQDAGPASDAPLRLIPSHRIEARSTGEAAGRQAAAAQQAASGARRP